MRGTFVGLKHISGEKNGRKYDFYVANITSEMGERDVNNGAKGLDIHSPSIPERYIGLLTEKNLGKNLEVEFYYSNGRENIAFAQFVD